MEFTPTFLLPATDEFRAIGLGPLSIPRIDMNIRIMDNTQRTKPTRPRPPPFRLRRRKRDLERLDLRERARAKERDTDEPRRLGPDFQASQAMRNNRPFESDRSLADVVIRNLQSRESAHGRLSLETQGSRGRLSRQPRRAVPSMTGMGGSTQQQQQRGGEGRGGGGSFTFSCLHALVPSATKKSSPRRAASLSWRSVAWTVGA